MKRFWNGHVVKCLLLAVLPFLGLFDIMPVAAQDKADNTIVSLPVSGGSLELIEAVYLALGH